MIHPSNYPIHPSIHLQPIHPPSLHPSLIYVSTTHAFANSSIGISIHSSIYSPTYPFIYLTIKHQPSIHQPIHSSIYSSTYPPLMHSLIHPLIRPSIHSSVHSSTYPLTHWMSIIHRPTCSSSHPSTNSPTNPTSTHHPSTQSGIYLISTDWMHNSKHKKIPRDTHKLCWALRGILGASRQWLQEWGMSLKLAEKRNNFFCYTQQCSGGKWLLLSVLQSKFSGKTISVF